MNYQVLSVRSGVSTTKQEKKTELQKHQQTKQKGEIFAKFKGKHAPSSLIIYSYIKAYMRTVRTKKCVTLLQRRCYFYTKSVLLLFLKKFGTFYQKNVTFKKNINAK